MSLGPINKEPIRDEVGILKPDQYDLFVIGDLDVVSSKESRIEKPFSQLTDSRKLSFKPMPVSLKISQTSRASESPVVSDEELKIWLLEMIKIPIVVKENRLLKLKEITPPSKQFAEEVVECCFSDIKNITVQFPKAVDNMMRNYNLRLYIVPEDGEVYEFFKKYGIKVPEDKESTVVFYNKATDRINLTILFPRKEMFREYSKLDFRGAFRTEFLRAIDVCAANPSGLKKEQTSFFYSELLNERLGEKLKIIAQRQTQNVNKARKEIESVEKLTKLTPQQMFEIYKKNKCLMRIAKIRGLTIPHYVTSHFDYKEVFVYSLDLYIKDKELLREIEPEMFEIIEKYVLPDLSK